jgi:hypothetical protein
MPTAGLPSLPRGVEGLWEHADQGGLLPRLPVIGSQSKGELLGGSRVD